MRHRLSGRSHHRGIQVARQRRHTEQGVVSPQRALRSERRTKKTERSKRPSMSRDEVLIRPGRRDFRCLGTYMYSKIHAGGRIKVEDGVVHLMLTSLAVRALLPLSLIGEMVRVPLLSPFPPPSLQSTYRPLKRSDLLHHFSSLCRSALASCRDMR